jgi:hypothetical protein
MTADAGDENALDLAARRLERALLMLEQRLVQRIAEASAGAGTAFDEDRVQLAVQLDHSRSRERQLEEAGAAASAALAKAIAEIRAALGEPEN